MMGRGFGLIAALALLAGCGTLGDARDAARGVDDAVRLLQDLDERGVWSTLRDAAGALEDVEHGYAAHIEVRMSGASPLTVQIRTDNDVEAWITIGQEVGGTASTQTYFVSVFEDAEAPANVYQVFEGEYACANAEAPYLQRGLTGLLEHYASEALGPELLAVTALEGAEMTYLGREATRLALEARRAEAVDVLRELDNADLARRVASAGGFDLAGEIVLDDETGALLAAESATTEFSEDGLSQFLFEVTEWDAAEDISAPPGGAHMAACR